MLMWECMWLCGECRYALGAGVGFVGLCMCVWVCTCASVYRFAHVRTWVGCACGYRHAHTAQVCTFMCVLMCEAVHACIHV